MEIVNDFQTSVRKALSEIDPEWWSYDGLIVCGTHAPHDMELLLKRIRLARETERPFLGICFGHQLAAIEYARNVLGQLDATSEEWGKGDFVVHKRPGGLKVGLHEGETWWNNYEVVPGFESMWIKPSHFITVQYHPEYQSSKDKPHPVLTKFIELCKRGNAGGAPPLAL